MSDMHCGALSGLTPPDWQIRYNKDVYKTQSNYWDWFAKEAGSIRPDILCVVGDAVDGKNQKNHGIGCITSDLEEQAAMATEVIQTVGAPTIYMVRGTDYHVNPDGTEIENMIASNVKASIHNRLFLNIEGRQIDSNPSYKRTIDLKHKVGSSSVPYGMFTAQAREATWNLEWATEGAQPLADIIVRGHVHRFSFCGTSRYTAINLAGMQLPLYNIYGEKQCVKVVDVGFVVLSFDEDTAALVGQVFIPYTGFNYQVKAVSHVL